MKVVILTSEESFSSNCGAVLQGYALQKVIASMGYDTEIARYKGGNPNSSLSAKCKDLLSFAYHKVLWRVADSGNKSPYQKEMAVQKKHFEEFQKSHIKFANTKRMRWSSFKHQYPIADIYVCGSDQIWNPYYKSGYNDPGYFLDFALDGSKRIAYAPSFGCDDIPKTSQKNLAYYINQFDAVSVREPEGAEIIKKYTGNEVEVLLDPIFLITRKQWIDFANTPSNLPKKYIFCYRLLKNDYMTECLNKLSEALDLPVVILPLSESAYNNSYLKSVDSGIEEFVGLIKNAELVCTDSFHGTAFSLILNKPFYTFPDLGTTGCGRNMNCRIRNILKFAGLKDRILSEGGDFDPGNIPNTDFSVFNSFIAEERKKSLSWLSVALTK